MDNNVKLNNTRETSLLSQDRGTILCCRIAPRILETVTRKHTSNLSGGNLAGWMGLVVLAGLIGVTAGEVAGDSDPIAVDYAPNVDVRDAIVGARDSIVGARDGISDVNKSISDARISIADARNSISDVHISVSDVRNSISDVRNSIAGAYNCVAGARDSIVDVHISAVLRDRVIKENREHAVLHVVVDATRHKQAPEPRNPVLEIANLIRGSPHLPPVNREPARIPVT
ncbi:MAG: hypothetical protein LBG30_04460 [Odoribacteraceae bacterium]|jgi:hypothetical protein|nr:hypothetical protein [Odoribacteraceae bacterium]